MNERIAKMREFFIFNKEHHKYRQPPISKYTLAEQFERENTPALDRAVARVRYQIEKEKPVVFPFEKIAVTRTVPETQEIFTKG